MRLHSTHPTIVLAIIASLAIAAVVEAAPRRTRATTESNPVLTRRVPAANSSANNSRRPQATTGRFVRQPSSSVRPTRPSGVVLDITPNIDSNRPQTRPRPQPRPRPQTRPNPRPTAPPNLAPNPRPIPPRPTAPPNLAPNPRPRPQPPTFEPPSRVPTPPPVVTIPPRDPRPTPPAPKPVPPARPVEPQKPVNPPLIIVPEDAEGEGAKKPLGDPLPEVGKDGVPTDPSLADKLDQFDKPSKEAADALKELFGPNFQDKLTSGQLDALINSEFGQQFKLGKQWNVKVAGGDVAMAMGFHKMLLNPGGWKHAPCLGPIGHGFVGGCFGMPYCGPCFFPGHVWCPHWCGWMNWGCWHTCHWFWNPHPFHCHPIAYHPCGGWIYWDCPVWTHLHWISCGTWWNVPIVHLPANGKDLQLLSVRYVDSGHPEKDQGPRYRVKIRSNSTKFIVKDFNVMIFAGNDSILRKGLPQTGARVKSIAPGEVLTFDLRLPAEANSMGINKHGQAVPFDFLHVLVDSHREVPEVFEKNNGATLDRELILPVDPSAFAIDTNLAAAGDEITIAGEGFGGMPGKVVVFVGDVSFDAEIVGWYDLAARVKLPAIPLAGATDVEVVVMRRDGAAANPLTLRLVPGEALSVLEPPKP